MKFPITPALMLLSAVPFFSGIARLAGLAGAGALEGHERFAADPVPAVLHIVGATCFATLGALQFSARLRKTRWHRVVGRVLAPFAIVAAMSGVWMVLTWPPKPYDSLVLNVMRVAAAIAMTAFIITSVVAARRRNLKTHRRWMVRAYALGATPGTQFLTVMPFLVFESMRSASFQAVLMGAAWVINIGTAEWALRRRGAPMDSSRVDSSPLTTVLAVRHERYADASALKLCQVPRRDPGLGQVRVRVHAAALNSMDSRIMRADPFLVRLHFGLLRPRVHGLGADLAGVVEAVGAGVTAFAVGEEVFGELFLSDGLGAFAEECVVSEKGLAKKPRALSFVEAAALPLASVTALQAVRDRAELRRGQSVLIQGAGGGVGTFLVQLAKAAGARVTAVCGPASVALVRSLGADEVIDYTSEDFADGKRTFDAIFGVNGYRPLGVYLKHLKAGGTYVMVGGSSRQIFQALLLGRLRFAGSQRRVEVLTIDDSRRARDLAEVQALVANGQLRVSIDRVFPFEQAREAFAYVERGHVRGKVVLEMIGGPTSDASVARFWDNEPVRIAI